MKHNPGFLQLVAEAKKRIKECSIAEVKMKLDSGMPLHFIDVREDQEFAEERAAGARHIGRGVLERDIETLIPDKTAEIIVYCGGGFRSTLAADVLQRLGYSKVASMDGGIKAWRNAGYPMSR